MSDKKYKVIVSDRAKRMLGTHIRFMAQVNKEAVKTKKKELIEANGIKLGNYSDITELR